MSKYYEAMLERIQSLPEEERERWAEWILSELESEQRWQELFARSDEMLARWAQEAREEHDRGKTLPLELE
ncbi:MAG: hypothetical protein NZ550_05335 [Fimbriimonadales bacterium]|nr:hypothetical protein [Fimbriimonadales bacterium]MDW8051147.1 hypothetical protein [Armatimonadota bacterium]